MTIYDIMRGDDGLMIPYRPELNDITGDVLATLILMQVAYLYSKNGKFYKFKEPCLQHKLYRVGDSWTETLNISRGLFDRALGLIGYKEGGKNKLPRSEALIIYNTDQKRLTWYSLNEEVLMNKLQDLHANREIPMPCKIGVAEELPLKPKMPTPAVTPIVERRNELYEELLRYFNHPTPQEEGVHIKVRLEANRIAAKVQEDASEYLKSQLRAYQEFKAKSNSYKHETVWAFLQALYENDYIKKLALLNAPQIDKKTPPANNTAQEEPESPVQNLVNSLKARKFTNPELLKSFIDKFGDLHGKGCNLNNVSPLIMHQLGNIVQHCLETKEQTDEVLQVLRNYWFYCNYEERLEIEKMAGNIKKENSLNPTLSV